MGKLKGLLCLLAMWLRSRRTAIVLFVVLDAVLFAVYGLNRALDWGNALYAALLGAAVGALFAAVDFVRFVARHRQLEKLAGRFPTGMLPAPADSIEQDYRQIVLALEAERERLVEELARRQRDGEQYYQLWIHQVKTPLAAMRLLLQQDAAAGGDAALRGKLAQELFRVEQYTDMALQYQRLASLQADMLLESHSIQALVNKALKTCAPLFIGKGLPVRPGPLQGTVVTDEKWFCFVLEQLLTNAAKYTQKGEVRIYTEGESTLVIQDTGIGIAGEDLPRVFERGYTGHAGRQNLRSTGIGLYLCREVSVRLGFAIELESRPGRGTTVRLLLAQNQLELD